MTDFQFKAIMKMVYDKLKVVKSDEELKEAIESFRELAGGVTDSRSDKKEDGNNG